MIRRQMLCLCLMTVVATSLSVVADEVTAPATSGDAIQLKAAEWDEVVRFIVGHPGKVVVVDLWSTACLPCMEEFPNLVSLQQQHGDKIVCVSVNMDYAGIKSRPPEYYRPRVEKFLAEHDAKLHNFLCTNEANEVFEKVKINSIPAVFVFGRDGKLIKRFDESLIKEGAEEAFTYKDDVTPYINSVVKK